MWLMANNFDNFKNSLTSILFLCSGSLSSIGWGKLSAIKLSEIKIII